MKRARFTEEQIIRENEAGAKAGELSHARQKLMAWANDYNTSRPHSSIGYLTPAAYAASLTATGRPAA